MRGATPSRGAICIWERERGGDAEMAHGLAEVDPWSPPELLGHEQTQETYSAAGTIVTTHYIMGVAARATKPKADAGWYRRNP